MQFFIFLFSFPNGVLIYVVTVILTFSFKITSVFYKKLQNDTQCECSLLTVNLYDVQ